MKELRVASGLCLLGSALVLIAVSRSWLSYGVGAPPPLPSRTVHVDGAALAPGARVLGLVGLAGVAALPATRRLGRTVVGALVLAAGLGVVAVLGRALAQPGRLAAGHGLGGWPYVGMLGGLVLALAGLLVVVRGRRWEGLSSRYDAPTKQPPPGSETLWDAIDRGDDPTRP